MPWFSRENKEIREQNMFFSFYIPPVLPFSYKLKLRKDKNAQTQKKKKSKIAAILNLN